MTPVEIDRDYRIAFRNDPKDPNFGKTVKVRQRDPSGDCLVRLPSGKQLRYHESLLRSREEFASDNEDLHLARMLRQRCGG